MSYIGKTPTAVPLTSSDIPDSTISQADLVDQAVNEAKMQVSNSPTNGYFLSAQSGNTGGMTWAEASGGVNTPIFHAQMSSGENVSDNSFTKASFQTEVIDTASAFASSRFTVPSNQGGRYFIYGQIRCEVDTNGQLQDAYCLIYKNGSAYQERRINFNDNNIRNVSVDVSAVVDLSATDYVELYGAVNTTSSQASFNNADKGTFFGGFKLIQ